MFHIQMEKRPKLRVVLALFCALMVSWPSALAAQVATPVASPIASPVSGIMAAGALRPNMDLSVDPGQDFYRYATGAWQDHTTIPADEAAYGISQQLTELTRKQLLTLLDRLANSNQLTVGSDEWKAVQLFEQGKDYATRNAQGIGPIAADLAAIKALSSKEELEAFLRDETLTTNVPGFFGIGGAPDLADSSVYTAWYGGPSLGLPNRDYYWVDTPQNEKIREAYQATSAKLLGYAGYDADRAKDAAARIYEFEKRLAEPLLRPQDYNDPANYYNPRPIDDLIKANPHFDVPGYLAILGIPDIKTVVVPELKYMEAMDGIIQDTDLETIKDYLTNQVLWNTASALTKEMDDTAFSFAGTALYGVEEQRPDEEQALGAVNGNLGFALGKLYAQEYFPPEAKAQIEELVAGLKAATRQRIEALTWMSPETKQTALAKLDAMRVKVGYPDKWRTYENVQIGESYVQTLLNANIAEAKRNLARIGKPVDRDEWHMLPQTVNAYYSPSNNEIVFPAAILQAPYFDYRADLASNYGSIGATIGHEITHAFDQSGSRFDAKGNLNNWWTDEDRSRFEALTKKVADQYSKIEVLPGLDVNGELTIGENIADMGGLQIAYDALHAALKESGDPGPIEGFTPDQRFFIAFALSWAEKARQEALRAQMQSDEHAPAQVRAVEPERNMDPFYQAFDIGPGDPMYLPPDERVVIW
jgi:predicted metalloendopeptidase